MRMCLVGILFPGSIRPVWMRMGNNMPVNQMGMIKQGNTAVILQEQEQQQVISCDGDIFLRQFHISGGKGINPDT